MPCVVLKHDFCSEKNIYPQRGFHCVRRWLTDFLSIRCQSVLASLHRLVRATTPRLDDSLLRYITGELATAGSFHRWRDVIASSSSSE